MDLQVEIEKHSGFCGGVIRAIGRAERFLEEHPGETLYSLGDIVHNEAELRRLGGKGLVTISKAELGNISERALDGSGPSTGSGTGLAGESALEEDSTHEKLPFDRSLSLSKRTGKSNNNSQGATLLIRAHGEPPETYSLAESLGLTVIDCTCPVVLRLQKSIRKAYERLKPAGGQLIIFGKIGHAEVLGLLGQVGGDAVVIEDMPMLISKIEDGSILTDRPLEVFSQTTKSPVEYSLICKELSGRATAGIKVHDTICSQVASRHEELAEFALRHDVIVFVSGVSSSNGKVLFELCKDRNPRTYHISDPSGLSAEWFKDGDKVGICGATSTPGWLLAEVADAVKGFSGR